MKKKKKSGVIYTIVMVLIFVLGLGIMLYPTVSDWWNQRIQSRAIATYQQTVDSMTEEEYNAIFLKAAEYNDKLKQVSGPLFNYNEVEGYYETLNITGTGIMGYVSIPNISVQLPIYHGTSDEVLNVAVGHFQGTTLPIGGEGTHAVIMAHRGLPSAKLFSDLDEMVVGDTFVITILNETYTYEVDKISIVLPTDTGEIQIVEGEDYVTLLTCTPYGVNSHRLLVRGKRIANVEDVVEVVRKVSADAMQVDPMMVMPIVAIPLLLILIISWNVSGKLRKRKKFEPQAILKELECSDDK